MTLTQKYIAAQQSIDGKIAEFCRVQNITAKHLANTIGISAQTLSNKRNGKTDWKQSELIALCDLFGCTQEELTGLKR